MYTRALELEPILKNRSCFLLGPRQTGKSTLLKQRFPEARYINLLEADVFREYSANPELLRQRLKPADRRIIIDEVQKLPSLLDEAQALIDRDKQLRFVFTGSSARKLKRGHANLLAGRAWFARLHPLVSPEVEFAQLERRLNTGGLPAVFDSRHPRQDLLAYVGSYLQEEIRGEALTRAIEPFSRFLTVAGLCNGESLNFTSIGSDCGVAPRTVREYVQILEDTLVGHVLPAFQKTAKRKPVATAKFYWFDVGVAHVLGRQGHITAGSSAYGRALEHLVFLELRAYLDYRRREDSLTYWRSLSQIEVDFVIDEHTAIEVKATGRVSGRDLKGLLALREEVPLQRMIVVCTERQARRTDEGVEVIPIGEFLETLWKGQLF